MVLTDVMLGAGILLGVSGLATAIAVLMDGSVRFPLIEKRLDALENCSGSVEKRAATRSKSDRWRHGRDGEKSRPEGWEHDLVRDYVSGMPVKVIAKKYGFKGPNSIYYPLEMTAKLCLDKDLAALRAERAQTLANPKSSGAK